MYVNKYNVILEITFYTVFSVVFKKIIPRLEEHAPFKENVLLLFYQKFNFSNSWVSNNNQPL